MSKYFSPETCQLLEKLGLTSESGKAWFIKREYQVNLGSGQVFPQKQGEPFLGDDNQRELEFPVERLSTAYTPADIILSAENAKKLWGEDTLCECASLNCTQDGHSDLEELWAIYTNQILNDIWGEKDIEPLIAEAAKQRLEEK